MVGFRNVAVYDCRLNMAVVRSILVVHLDDFPQFNRCLIVLEGAENV